MGLNCRTRGQVALDPTPQGRPLTDPWALAHVHPESPEIGIILLFHESTTRLAQGHICSSVLGIQTQAEPRAFTLNSGAQPPPLTLGCLAHSLPGQAKHLGPDAGPWPGLLFGHAHWFH